MKRSNSYPRTVGYLWNKWQNRYPGNKKATSGNKNIIFKLIRYPSNKKETPIFTHLPSCTGEKDWKKDANFYKLDTSEITKIYFLAQIQLDICETIGKMDI